jgi:hypothetical protein
MWICGLTGTVPGGGPFLGKKWGKRIFPRSAGFSGNGYRKAPWSGSGKASFYGEHRKFPEFPGKKWPFHSKILPLFFINNS